VTSTRTIEPTYVPPPAKDLPYLAVGAKPHKGEVEKLCPYIRTGKNMDPTDKPNVADIEGSRIYRTTVITTTTPHGCRFWYYGGNYATADIVPKTFASDIDAHNAMVLTARAQGTDLDSRTNIAPGVDAVLFRTKFYDQDKGQDWACAFAKGKVMVVVRTARVDTSRNALYLAQAIVDKF
jgi:hypothetical protein